MAEYLPDIPSTDGDVALDNSLFAPRIMRTILINLSKRFINITIVIRLGNAVSSVVYTFIASPIPQLLQKYISVGTILFSL